MTHAMFSTSPSGLRSRASATSPVYAISASGDPPPAPGWTCGAGRFGRPARLPRRGRGATPGTPARRHPGRHGRLRIPPSLAQVLRRLWIPRHLQLRRDRRDARGDRRRCSCPRPFEVQADRAGQPRHRCCRWHRRHAAATVIGNDRTRRGRRHRSATSSGHDVDERARGAGNAGPRRPARRGPTIVAPDGRGQGGARAPRASAPQGA